MSKVENEYNKRFKDKQESNFEFDKEDLWNSINSEIPKNDKRRKFIIFFLFSLMLSICAAFVFSTWDFGESTNHINSNSHTFTSTNKDIITNTKNKLSAEQRKSTFSNKSNSDSNSSKGSVSSSTGKEIEFKDNTKEKLNALLENTPDLKISKPFIKSSESLENNTKKSEINKAQAFISNTASQHENSKQENTIRLAKLDHIKFLEQRIAFKNEKSKPAFKIVDLSKDGEIEKKEKNALVLGIYGGPNKSSISFSTLDQSIQNSKNEAETGYYGSSYGLSLNYKLANNYSITSGIEYHDIWTKLDWTFQERIEVLKENEIVKFIIDANSMDTLDIIRQDTMIGADYFKTVVHHNNIQQITFPFLMGHQFSKSNWTLELQLGLELNYLISQSGRTIDLIGNDFKYENTSSLLPYPAFQFGLRLNTSVSYAISENLFLSIQGNYRRSSSLLFSDENSRTKLGLTGLQLGLHYKM